MKARFRRRLGKTRVRDRARVRDRVRVRVSYIKLKRFGWFGFGFWLLRSLATLGWGFFGLVLFRLIGSFRVLLGFLTE